MFTYITTAWAPITAVGDRRRRALRPTTTPKLEIPPTPAPHSTQHAPHAYTRHRVLTGETWEMSGGNEPSYPVQGVAGNKQKGEFEVEAQHLS